MRNSATVRTAVNFVKLLILFSLIWCGVAAAQEIVTLSTRSGVTQSFLLTAAEEETRATVMLFPGSGGWIRLRQENGRIRFSPNNFLVRSRDEFTKRGVVSALMDAPSDWQSERGMSDDFRLGEDHFFDIGAALADLKKRFPGKPVFLVGTSRGTVSAASLGARFGQQVSGIILSATVFRRSGRRSRASAPGLSEFDFASIKAPLLFVHHVGDQCQVTPYDDAARLAAKYPMISVAGGLPPQSGPCDALSAHGFLGKESATVEQMVNWMLKKPFRSEVD